MARIRSIKPEFPQSESMGRVSRDARLLFVMLWPICDDHGRTRAASRMLASTLFPYDDDAKDLIDLWLDELEREGCIRRYEVAGSQYLEIHNWLKHQRIDKPSKPQFPEPPGEFASPREASWLEGKGKEWKGRDESEVTDIAIPLADGSDYVVPLASVAEWEQAYPRLDVMAELRKARAWCVANPRQRKTRVGASKFLNGWLSRASERATPPPAAPSKASLPGGGRREL